MWLIFGCQVVLTTAWPGQIECEAAVSRVAEERISSVPVLVPQRMLVPGGEKMMFEVGWGGVGKEVRVVIGDFSLRVSQTGLC